MYWFNSRFLVVDNVFMRPEKEPEAPNLIGAPLLQS